MTERQRALIPFGLGPRGCIGQHLAMAEMSAVLPVLARHGNISVEGTITEDPSFALRVRPQLKGRFTATGPTTEPGAAKAAGAPTAKSGQWVPGPGAGFFGAVEKALGGLPFLAEDLGTITPDVVALRDAFHLPGTRVLQFAFDGHDDNPYLPKNYAPNTIVYTGTHDNPTTRGWYEDLPDAERGNLWRYLQRAPGTSADATAALLGLAWSSVAALAIAPLQDVLSLGKEARMNQPGTAEGNWRWRYTDEMLSASAFPSLRDLTHASLRLGDVEMPRPDASMAATS